MSPLISTEELGAELQALEEALTRAVEEQATPKKQLVFM